MRDVMDTFGQVDIIDENIDLSEGIHHVAHKRLCRHGVGGVSCREEYLASGVAHQRGGVFGRFMVLPVGKSDIRSRMRKGHGTSLADALRSTGNDRYLIFQFSVHGLYGLL